MSRYERSHDLTARVLPSRVRLQGCILWSLGLAWPLLGCGKANQYQPPPPPTVTVATPLIREIPEYLEFTGTAQAMKTVEVRARVNGYLKQILYQDGQDVQADAPLFVIEPEPFEMALASAKANQEKAAAESSLAEAELGRTEELFKKNVSTKSNLDVATAQRDVSRAVVDVQKAATSRAELDLGYTLIKSPMMGRLSRHLVEPGSLVQAEQTLLTTIYQLDPIHVYFPVSERDVLQIRSRRMARTGSPERRERVVLDVGLANEEGYPHTGYLDFSEPSADPKTGTFLVRGLFDNPDFVILPGMFVRVRSRMGRLTGAICVPEAAVGADQLGRFVLVVNDANEVERRTVVLGSRVDQQRVIESGLTGQERVIINGLQRVRPGVKVTVELAKLEGAEGPGGAGQGDEAATSSAAAVPAVDSPAAGETVNSASEPAGDSPPANSVEPPP